MHHELKIQRQYWNSLCRWDKKSEVRYNDRDYQKGDTISFLVQLSEWDSCSVIRLADGIRYQETSDKWKITHVLHFPEGLQDGWVVLSLKKI